MFFCKKSFLCTLDFMNPNDTEHKMKYIALTTIALICTLNICWANDKEEAKPVEQSSVLDHNTPEQTNVGYSICLETPGVC